MGHDRGKVAPATWALALIGLCMGWSAAEASELTTSDRLALLYSPQLQFSVDGDPLIKIGLVEGQREIAFTPQDPILVLPLGEGGPEIRLPGAVEYRVTLISGQPGTYRYWATVGRTLPSERAALAELVALWESRGYAPERFDLGSFFAIRGTTFDNRQTVVAVGGVEDRAHALRLAGELEAAYGVPQELHTELVDFPSGELELGGIGLDISVRHRDLLWIETEGQRPTEVDGAAFASPGDEATPRRFVGSLIFTLDRSGGLALVNELPAERLLEGVVPAEIYASAPANALRSQAVAARGELLADLGVRYLADPYMTCADVRCQVYRGVGQEDPRTSQAVQDSRGVVLLYDGHLARTVYSASCGGSAGDFASTWGDAPLPYLTHHLDTDHPPPEFSGGIGEERIAGFLAADLDTFDHIEQFGGSRVHRWTVRLDARQLTDAVNERHSVGRVTDLEILARDRSGRVTALRIVGQDGEVVVERELAVRRALGGLRSALFVLDLERDADGAVRRVIIDGGGYGHGVGLCQTGAIGAALQGLDYLEILSHYYPGTQLAQLWE